MNNLYTTISGYDNLDDLNKATFHKFILNFLSGLDAETRATLIPQSVAFVEEIEYLSKFADEDDYTAIGGVVMGIDKYGVKTILHKWETETTEYKDQETKEIKTRYLRFEYKIQGRSSWLHVLKEDKWY